MATDIEAQTDLEPMVCCPGERVSLGVEQSTGDIYAVCSGCGHEQRLRDDDQFAEAEADGIAWAEKVARKFVATLGAIDTDEAGRWAEVLHWFANRLRGGHLSVAAHEEFAQRFGLPRDFKPGGDHG